MNDSVEVEYLMRPQWNVVPDPDPKARAIEVHPAHPNEGIVTIFQGGDTLQIPLGMCEALVSAINAAVAHSRTGEAK